MIWNGRRLSLYKMANTESPTSGPGFLLRPTRNITQREIILITDRLGEVFGPGWKFEPEAITEGGIIITQWPGKTSEMYKTLRFSLVFNSEPLRNKWPIVKPVYREEWLQGTALIFKADPTYPHRRFLSEWIGTRLKAFWDAPKWTRTDLMKFEVVFSEFGFIVHYKESYIKV